MRVCHLAITHQVLSDSRIMEKMARSNIKLGNETFVITSGLTNKNYKGVEIISVSSSKPSRKFYIFTMLKCFYAAMKAKADIYHIHEVPLMLIGFILVIFGKKVVVDFHEDFEAELRGKKYLNNFLIYLFIMLYKPFKFLILPWFHHIVLAEDGYTKNFENLSNKVSIVRNYPITEMIKFSEAFGKNELRVLYLGTITEDRGCLNIIDAVEQLNRNGKFNITLDLIGPIHDSSLKMLIKKKIAGSSSFICWKDSMPYNQVVKEITNYDVGFAALHDDPNYKESLPTKLLEYNAAGLFSIVSNLPISHRYVTEDVNAIIVEPDNTNSVIQALERIWDKKLYQNRKVISELTAAKYSWNSQFHILNKCYLKILGR